MYVMPLDYTLNMSKMVNFMLHIFYHSNRKDWWRGAILARAVRAGLLEEVVFEQRSE